MLKRRLTTCEEEVNTKEKGLLGHYHHVSEDLIKKLSEQKVVIRKLTKQVNMANWENQLFL